MPRGFVNKMRILSETEIMSTRNELIGIILFILLAIFVVIGICIIIKYYTIKEFIWWVFIVIVWALIVSFFFQKPIKEYKVIFDENYPAINVLDKYEVVGRDGEIYILRDKEPRKEGESGE